MRRRGRTLRGCQRGLTLLELLISMTILGLIFVIIGSALRVSYNAITAGDMHIDRVHRVRVMTEQIAQELRSAYRLSQLGSTEEVTIFRGEPSRFTFVTTTPLRIRSLRYSGLKEVTLSISDEDAPGQRGLVLHEDIIPHGELFGEGKGYRAVLDPTVVDMRCRYLGTPDGDEESGAASEWRESWESDRLPTAVEVALQFNGSKDGAKMELPPITLVLPVQQVLEAEKQ